MEENRFLGNQLHHLFALLLSVIAHLGLGFILGFGSGAKGGAAPRPQISPKILTISLGSLNSTTIPSSTRPTEYDKPANKLPAHPANSQALLRLDEDVPVLAIVGKTEPYYFRPRELTEKPYILQDVPSDLIVVLSNTAPQPAVVRLLINEQGYIDKVMIEESSLPAKAEQAVIDAFANIKFYPGKIDNIPVKSQLRIEVALENAISLVVPPPVLVSAPTLP